MASFLRLPLRLPHRDGADHDGLYLQTVIQNKPVLPQVAVSGVYHSSKRIDQHSSYPLTAYKITGVLVPPSGSFRVSVVHVELN